MSNIVTITLWTLVIALAIAALRWTLPRLFRFLYRFHPDRRHDAVARSVYPAAWVLLMTIALVAWVMTVVGYLFARLAVEILTEPSTWVVREMDAARAGERLSG